MARVIQGVGLGGEVPIAAVYISEIAKAHGRGRFVLLYENIFSVGVVITSLLGSILVPMFGWQSLFLIGGVPIVLAIVIPVALPESPRWLASRDRMADADAAVTEIEQKTIRATGSPLPKIGPIIEAEIKGGSWRDLLAGIYLRRSLVVWVIWFASFLVYYSLNIWLPTLYRSVFNLPLDQALRYGILTSVASLAGTLTAAFIVDTFGRRPVFAVSLACAAACLFGLWGLGATTLIQVVVLGCAACFFAGIAGLTVYVYTPELYPTRTRALGTAIASAFLRIGSIVGPLIVGSTLSRGVSFVCFTFGVIALVAALIVACFAVETSQKTLEELSP